LESLKLASQSFGKIHTWLQDWSKKELKIVIGPDFLYNKITIKRPHFIS